MASKNPFIYQQFISNELKNIKTQNPNLNHKEAFKLAVERWREQKAGSSQQFPSPVSLQEPQRPVLESLKNDFFDRLNKLSVEEMFVDDNTSEYNGERIDLLIDLMMVLVEINNETLRNELKYYKGV